MLKLILDTNILCSDYWFHGTNFRILFEGQKILPIEVYVTEVVLEETVNRFKEDLEEKLTSVRKAVVQLNKILKSESANELQIDVSSQTEKYRSFLDSELKQRGIKVLPYPEIDHKKVVEHDLKRLKPFKPDGSGYRDFLIWTCVEKESGIEHEVIFATANSNDFGSGPEPHPDLPRRKPWGGKVTIIQSLNAFNESHVTKHLTTRDKLKEHLKSADAEFFDIYGWTKERLVETIRHEDWIGPIVFGLPEGLCSLMVSRLEDITSIDVEDVFEIENGRVLVHCEIKLRLRFYVSADRFDLEHSEVRELFGEEDNTSTNVTMWPAESLTIGFNFLLNPDAKTLVDYEIATVESDIDRIEFESGYAHSL